MKNLIFNFWNENSALKINIFIEQILKLKKNYIKLYNKKIFLEHNWVFKKAEFLYLKYYFIIDKILYNI